MQLIKNVLSITVYAVLTAIVFLLLPYCFWRFHRDMRRDYGDCSLEELLRLEDEMNTWGDM